MLSPSFERVVVGNLAGYKGISAPTSPESRPDHRLETDGRRKSEFGRFVGYMTC